MQLRLHLVITVLLSLFFYSGNCQPDLKIGHINIPEIVQKHPVLDSIQMVLKVETNEMEKIYGSMIEEHESKLKIFEKEQSGYSEFVRKTKQEELIQMSQKIQQYNQNAQQQLQKRNMELLQPVYSKINEAIKVVADRDGFTYILETSNGNVAYMAPSSKDISLLVVEELGISGN